MLIIGIAVVLVSYPQQSGDRDRGAPAFVGNRITNLLSVWNLISSWRDA